MAEPVRRAARARRASYRAPLLLAIASAVAAIAACSDRRCDEGTCVDESGMRLLDRACAQVLVEGPACEVRGAVAKTSAVTEDTIGYRLGSAGGTLIIHLQALSTVTATSGQFEIEVLAATRRPGEARMLATTLHWGTCGSSCPADPEATEVQVGEEYAWLPVVTGVPTTSASPPYDAVLTLGGTDIDIADIRSTAFYVEGCSVAGPPGGPR